MKAWKSGCLGVIYIQEISKNKFLCKILDLIGIGESEIARKRFFCQGCVAKSRSHEEILKDEDEGQDNRSGMRFRSPFICWTVKSYFENQVLSRRRCLFGRALFLNLRIFGNEELSNLTRKLWQMALIPVGQPLPPNGKPLLGY